MTKADVEKLIADDEGGVVEVKETTGQRVEACRTLCAFLNGKGGSVVFGVTKKGELTGQLVSDETKQTLARAFYDFEPGTEIGVEYVDVDATHQAIVCTVERGARRPYVYDGRPYKRVESTTVRMPQEEYEAMLKERGGYASGWEKEINPSISLDDIDLAEVCATARRAVHVGRLDDSVDTNDAVGLLDHFNVRKDGQLQNAAAVLFGKINVGNYSQCQLKMGWFKGTTTDTFHDIDRMYGNIGQLMDAAMRFCFKHLNLSARISGKIEREEELEIPAAALREAMINAFAHRSYEHAGTSVYLAIFDDRVEIKNPGTFPPGFDVSKLFTQPKDESVLRNPVIADVLYMRKSIETWGRGLGVIAKECKRTGLPPPSTVVRGGYVVTSFKRPVIPGSGSNLDRRDPDLIQIDPDSDNNLNSRLLAAMRLNPLISRKLLAEELKISERKVREIIGTLRKDGIVVRQGPEHGGIWRISKIITEVTPNDPVNEPLNPSDEPVNEPVKSRTGSVTDSLNDPLKTVILRLIREQPGVSRPALVKLTGKSRATITRILSSLQGSGLIEHRGSDKTGGYYVKGGKQ